MSECRRKKSVLACAYLPPLPKVADAELEPDDELAPEELAEVEEELPISLTYQTKVYKHILTYECIIVAYVYGSIYTVKLANRFVANDVNDDTWGFLGVITFTHTWKPNFSPRYIEYFPGYFNLCIQQIYPLCMHTNSTGIIHTCMCVLNIQLSVWHVYFV